MDGQKLSQINERMESYVADGTVSGAVTLIAKDGKVVHLGAVGTADIESKRPMTSDSIFRIASMTKPVTATALMILVDEQKVALDDPVSAYLPAFADAKTADGALDRPITVRDCLTHTAGLGGAQIFSGSLESNTDELAKRTLLFQPGTKWAYSPGLNVIGRIIEVVSGQTYGKFVEQRIFEPLGMKDTTFYPTDEQWERVATVYKPGAEKGGLVPVTTGWSTVIGREAQPQPSGGLFSTAADLARFYQMVLNGGQLDGKRILSPEAVRQMTSVQTDGIATGFTPGNGWGLGWCIVREPQGVSAMLSPGTFGHGGAFGTQGWVDPARKMIFVLLIQREGLPNADASTLRNDLQQLAVDSLTH